MLTGPLPLHIRHYTQDSAARGAGNTGSLSSADFSDSGRELTFRLDIADKADLVKETRRAAEDRRTRGATHRQTPMAEWDL